MWMTSAYSRSRSSSASDCSNLQTSRSRLQSVNQIHFQDWWAHLQSRVSKVVVKVIEVVVIGHGGRNRMRRVRHSDNGRQILCSSEEVLIMSLYLSRFVRLQDLRSSICSWCIEANPSGTTVASDLPHRHVASFMQTMDGIFHHYTTTKPM